MIPANRSASLWIQQPKNIAVDGRIRTMTSRQLAGLIGPALVALGATEAFNIQIFESQIAPVVYLNGTILFIAGLALVRAHNRWSWSWPALITVTGWVLLLSGLYRMIVPQAPQAQAGAASYVMLAAIVMIGLFLSFKGYGPEAASGRPEN
jgi:hypothetical protein